MGGTVGAAYTKTLRAPTGARPAAHTTSPPPNDGRHTAAAVAVVVAPPSSSAASLPRGWGRPLVIDGGGTVVAAALPLDAPPLLPLPPAPARQQSPR